MSEHYPSCVTDPEGHEWSVSPDGRITKVVPPVQEYPKWVEGFGIVNNAATEQKLRAGTHRQAPNPESATGADPVVRHVVPVGQWSIMNAIPPPHHVRTFPPEPHARIDEPVKTPSKPRKAKH